MDHIPYDPCAMYFYIFQQHQYINFYLRDSKKKLLGK